MQHTLPLRERINNVKQMLSDKDAVHKLANDYNLTWYVVNELARDAELFMPVEGARNPIVKLIREVGVYQFGRYWLDRTKQGVSIRVASDWNTADYNQFLQLLAQHGYDAEYTKSNRVLVRNA